MDDIFCSNFQAGFKGPNDVSVSVCNGTRSVEFVCPPGAKKVFVIRLPAPERKPNSIEPMTALNLHSGVTHLKVSGFAHPSGKWTGPPIHITGRLETLNAEYIDWEDVIGLCKQSWGLQFLSVSCCVIDDERMLEIQKYVPGLKGLMFKNCRFKRIPSTFETMFPNLQHFHVVACGGIDVSGATFPPSVERLRIEYCAPLWGFSMMKLPPELEVLSLIFNNIQWVSTAMKMPGTLKTILLGGNPRIDDDIFRRNCPGACVESDCFRVTGDTRCMYSHQGGLGYLLRGNVLPRDLVRFLRGFIP